MKKRSGSGSVAGPSSGLGAAAILGSAMSVAPAAAAPARSNRSVVLALPQFQTPLDDYGRTLGELPRAGVAFLETESGVDFELVVVFMRVSSRLLEYVRKIPVPNRGVHTADRLVAHEQLVRATAAAAAAAAGPPPTAHALSAPSVLVQRSSDGGGASAAAGDALPPPAASADGAAMTLLPVADLPVLTEPPASLSGLEVFAKGGFGSISHAMYRAARDPTPEFGSAAAPAARKGLPLRSSSEGLRSSGGSAGSNSGGVSSDKPTRVVVKKTPHHAVHDVHHNAAERSVLLSAAHPNIIRCLATYVVAPGPEMWFVLEQIDGCTMRDMLEAPCKSAHDVAVYVGVPLFSALAYLHAREVVHCDVKPENVLVSVDGAVKLIDFGLARSCSLCVPGEMLGSSYWMAPEMIRGDAYGAKVDVYSAAKCLIALFVGTIRDYGFAFRSMFLAATCSMPRYFADALAAMDPTLAAVLESAIAPDPADRPTAAEVGERLLALHSAGMLKKVRSEVKRGVSWHKKNRGAINQEKD